MAEIVYEEEVHIKVVFDHLGNMMFNYFLGKRVKCSTCRGEGFIRQEGTNKPIQCYSCYGLGITRNSPYYDIVWKLEHSEELPF